MGSNEGSTQPQPPVEARSVSALLPSVEDQWFERRGSAIASKDLAVTLVAFANAEGGVVIVDASRRSP